MIKNFKQFIDNPLRKTKLTTTLFLCLILTVPIANAQSNVDQPPAYQMGLQLGLFDLSINNEWTLNPKLRFTSNVGLGYFFLNNNDDMYNKYNRQYDFYNNPYHSMLNFGQTYLVGYIDASMRYTLYQWSPATHIYVALEARANTSQLDHPSNEDPKNQYRETYRIGGKLGFQFALNADRRWIMDTGLGLGYVTNYSWDTFEPHPLVYIKVKRIFWSK